MDKKIVPVTIPLSPSQVNEYCKKNNKENNDILFEFDISATQLSPSHILGYLSNLKIDFRVTNFGNDLFLEYLKTPFFVGHSNLAHMHAELLLWRMQKILPFSVEGIPVRLAPLPMYMSIPEELIEEQMVVIRSLPLFLIESAEVPGTIKEPLVGDGNIGRDNDTEFENVGVNIAHLVRFEEVLLQLCSPTLLEFPVQEYYTHYFDKYIYGGDPLIQFFIDHPNNLLHSAVKTLLVK